MQGAVALSPLTILKILLRSAGIPVGPATWQAADETILLELRLPRVLGGALVGAALATAGVLFQGLLRNPLADPYIIGTSAGAGFAATVAMLVLPPVSVLGFGSVALSAFVGGLLAVLLVYQLARVDGRSSPVTLLLAGVVVNTVLGYLGSLSILLFEGSEFRLRYVFTWLMGGIAVNDPRQLLAAGPIIVVGIVVAYGFTVPLNALTVGEEGAQALGVDLNRESRRIIVLGALLTGTAVSISGLIGFLGLAVPHIMRLLIGPDHRRLLPASALAGAALLVLADTAARSILAPTELPVGIFTALLGGPLFLFLLRRNGRESGWR
ncbi:FecCD family ABC transporter permease [Candidatus Methylomirabilis sp.]|uniref:FecCD family ABC transporter permease n=1 Tax=Candidatus Methylomirabilis sp. TaxID=2032687 RepID=UPI003C75FC86